MDARGCFTEKESLLAIDAIIIDGKPLKADEANEVEKGPIDK